MIYIALVEHWPLIYGASSALQILGRFMIGQRHVVVTRCTNVLEAGMAERNVGATCLVRTR